MARGWESKSVEEQMASAVQDPQTQPGNDQITDEDRRLAELKRTERERQKQALNLQRELVLSQRTSNSGRRSALEAALAQIESQIAALE
jgi:hypothetical protein